MGPFASLICGLELQQGQEIAKETTGVEVDPSRGTEQRKVG